MKISVFLLSVFGLLLLTEGDSFGQNGSTKTPAPSSSATVPASGHAIRVPPDSIHHLPGRGMLDAFPAPTRSYPDSVLFKKHFEELYSIIRTPEPLIERVQKQYKSMFPMYRRSGVDSAKAWEAVVKTLDTSHERTTAYNFYRQVFSAEDLKTYIEFLRTPAGKKFLGSQGKFGMLASDATTYPQRHISITLASLMKHGDPVPSQVARPEPHPATPPPAGTTPPPEGIVR